MNGKELIDMIQFLVAFNIMCWILAFICSILFS